MPFAGAASPLSLNGYCCLLAGVARPARAQIEAFVDYVCEARSWYKHLPLFPPGVMFVFYLDPFAGCDLRVTADGRMVWEERTEPGFHPARIETAAYREQFSCLGCTELGGWSFVYDRGADTALKPPTGALLMDDQGRWHALPIEVTEAAAVQLTAAIHPDSASPMCSLYLRPERWRMDTASLTWPEETGGRKTVEQILALGKVASATRSFEAQRLELLLKPERERQRALMVGAVERLCELIWPTRCGN